MIELFQNALEYLQESLRTYVLAKHIIDKLLATQLVVVSMIMSSDALILRYYDDLPEKKTKPGLSTEGLETVHIDAYRERVRDLQLIGAKYFLGKERDYSNEERELHIVLDQALNILEAVDLQKNLSALLSLNFKEFLNTATWFVLRIRREIPQANGSNA
ncbi:MAG: hypothetical protein ACFFD4_30780 [Candidatus Odinarchaeota archaeon]